jgi:hypothetical protein
MINDYILSDFIFQLLAVVGAITGLLCGSYLLGVARRFKGDSTIRGNLFALGIVNVLSSIVYWLAVLHVDGFALVSNFSKLMRILSLLFQLLPTFIAYRMGGRK